MEIIFKDYENKDKDELYIMIKDLYESDPGGLDMNETKIDSTIQFLKQHPESGRLFGFYLGELVIGYAILINYWSNEYGGILLNIDELYIKTEYRSLGIGTNFIKFIIDSKHSNFKAIELEVFPTNVRAFNLYTDLGFIAVKNDCLRLTLED